MSQPPAPVPRTIPGLGSQRPAQGLPVLDLDKRTYARAQDCVHCGLCLPACPTYTTNGLEADSPRGRIMLIKGMADGQIDPTHAVLRHLDGCLDCRACETACPSGVVYHELIEETRHQLAGHSPRTAGQHLISLITAHLFPHPTRLRLSLLPARLLQRIGLWDAFCRITSPLVPAELAKMQRMLPPRGPLWETPLAETHQPTAGSPSDTEPRRVGFFAGCVGSVLFQEVNRQSIQLLQHVGCTVTVPPAQRCCGAMAHHGGDVDTARAFARRNIDAFLPADAPPVDAIVTNIAGCGAMLRDHAHLLRDDPAYARRARQFESKVRDISEILLDMNLQPTRPVKAVATYHDACHLLHAQRVHAAPRDLLGRIDGLELIPLTESDMCCGAAGTYNLTEPHMAGQLGQRKIDHLRRTGASLCLTGNVGCAMQIQSEAARAGHDLEVLHPVTLLHRATLGR